MNTYDTLRNNFGGSRTWLANDIILPLSEAMIAYDSGDFDDAVNIVYPIRNKILHTGGSNAQVISFRILSTG